MRRIIKIIAILVILVLVALFILPFTITGKIETEIKAEVHEQFNADAKWNKFSVSVLSNFPNVGIHVNGLNVINDSAIKDTLLAAKKVSVTIGLLDVFSSATYPIKQVDIDNPIIHIKAHEGDAANKDVDSADSKSENKNRPNDAKVTSTKVSIHNASIYYADAKSKLNAHVKGLSMHATCEGLYSQVNIKLKANADTISLKHNNVSYLKNIKFGLDVNMVADLNEKIFKLGDNKLTLNNLPLKLKGSVQELGKSYDINLDLQSANTDVKSLLSMIPAEYLNNYKDIQTSGNMSINSSIKGTYSDWGDLPAFNFSVLVQNGIIHYARLPQSINNINVNLQVNKPEGSLDSTVVNLNSFHFELDKKPFDINFALSTPVSNAKFKGAVKGILNLSSLQNTIPLEGIKMEGVITSDLVFGGDVNMIKAENYEAVKVNGDIDLDNFVVENGALPDKLIIPKAKMTVSSEKITLKELSCSMGQSDFSFTGYVKSYLPYLFNNKKLSGRLQHHSRVLNLNELLYEENAQKQSALNKNKVDAKKIKLFEVPRNVDLYFTSNINKLIYDKLIVSNTRGKIITKDEQLLLEQFNMNLLGGRVNMSGKYNTQNKIKPYVDFAFNTSNIDVRKTVNALPTVNSLVSVAKNMNGKMYSNIKFHSVLNNDMSLNKSTMKGKGRIKSNEITVSNSESLNKMAALLRRDDYRTLTVKNIDINYTIQNNKIIIAPFSPSIQGAVFKIKGEQGFDKSINYVVGAPVSRKDIAKAMGFLGLMVNQHGKDIVVDVLIKGSVDNPNISLDMNKVQKQLKDELKGTNSVINSLLKDDDVKKTVDDVKNKLKDLFK